LPETASLTASAAGRPATRQLTATDLAIFAIAGLGVVLRLRQYLFNRSFWLDEAMLAQSFVHRDLGSLLLQPLDHAQTAPPGFVIAAYLVSALFGASDWALRLVPLSAGVMTVAVAVLLARRDLGTAAAKIAFVGLVALSPVLIYYASEFKQYSGEALFALGLLAALAYRNTRYGPWLVAMAGGLALACSLSAVFVATPAAVLLFIEWSRARRWRALIGVAAAWGFEFALHVAYMIRVGAPPAWLFEFWRAYFAPFPPRSAEDLLWYPRALSGLTYVAFRLTGAARPELFPVSFDGLTTVLTIAFLAAVAVCFTGGRRLALVAVATLGLALVAAMLALYPFSTRLLVYLVPLFFFIIATGIDQLARMSAVAGGTVAAACVAAIAYPAVGVGLVPEATPDIRAMLERIRPELDSDSGIAVAGWSEPQYTFYAPHLGLAKVRRFNLPREGAPADIIEGVERTHLKRVWFIGAFLIEKSDGMISATARLAPILKDWRDDGVRAVEFDFSDPRWQAGSGGAVDAATASVP